MVKRPSATNLLALLLAECRLPAGEPAHSGGVEEGRALGLIATPQHLSEFLHGRLLTMGSTAGFMAATVCASTGHGPVADSVWRSFEAEIDARILSPAARAVSRQLGARMLRQALSVSPDMVLLTLGRATVISSQQPHHAVAVGAVAAAADASAEEAATAAAYATIATALERGRVLLGLTANEFTEIAGGLHEQVDLISIEAARHANLSVSDLPGWSAPALEFLAEEETLAS